MTGDRQPDGVAAMVEALRAQGAERFDAAAFHFIEALARRAAAQPDDTRRMLERRLAGALAQYRERFEHARRTAADTLAHATHRFPEEADALNRCCEAGDFQGLQRLVARLETRGGPSPLAALLAHAGQPAAASLPATGTPGEVVAASYRELKSLQHFRRTWSKLGVDRQLSHAVARAPDNAGPLNSHHLALQALKQMRELSPPYLERFMSYVDALQWLDQADVGRSPTAVKGPDKGTRKGTRKATTRRERDRE